MRAVVIGAVEGTRVALDAIARSPGWDLAGVVTLPPELAARHSDFVDVGALGRSLGAEVIHAANGNDPAVVERVRSLSADLLFVIGWSQLCRTPMLQAARLGTIGYHPAPLPRLRGRAVIPWTILLGEPLTAGTLFWIDEGTDTGPILAQHFFHVAPDETAATLYERHMAVLQAMLGDSLPALAAGSARREPQDERFATWAARRTPEDGRIDWTQSAVTVDRLIRAVGRPYPGAFTLCGDERLVLWAAEPWPDGVRHVANPGQVLARGDHWFAVRCGDGGALRITEFDGSLPRLHAMLGAARA
jgi:methionyl-tRNA formyltransferase